MFQFETFELIGLRKCKGLDLDLAEYALSARGLDWKMWTWLDFREVLTPWWGPSSLLASKNVLDHLKHWLGCQNYIFLSRS